MKTRTSENKARIDSRQMSVSAFVEIRTWVVKLFDLRKMDGPSRNLDKANFLPKRKLCLRAFTSSRLCTEACIFAKYLSFSTYSLWIMDEGIYCYKISTNFLLGTWTVLSSIEFFYSGSKSMSSVLFTCLLRGCAFSKIWSKWLPR